MKEYSERELKEMWKELGRRGGLKTKEKYGPEHFRKLAQKRWAKQKNLELKNENE